MDVNDPTRDPFLLARYLEANPLAAAGRLGELPDPASTLPGEALLATAMQAPAGMGRALVVRETLGRLSVDDQVRLALRFPTVLGDPFNGAPFALCAAANRVKLTVALTEAETRLAMLSLPPPPDADRQARMERARTDRDVFQDLLQPLNPHEFAAGAPPEYRQIIYFDPNERAGVIEVHGDLSAATYVGMLVPGATIDRSLIPALTGVTRDYTLDQPPGGIAGVTFALGDFPAHAEASIPEILLDAFHSKYAKRTAPRLVDFTDLLRLEMAESAKLTVIGYSYGGVIAGTAAMLGMNADRLLHVLSAGGGIGVRSVDDYQRSDGGSMETFSLTNFTDYIHLARLFATHLGVNPHLSGAVRLAPGRYEEDFEIPAALAHLMAPYEKAKHLDDDLIRGIDGHIHTVLKGTSSARTIRSIVTYGDYQVADDRVDAIGRIQQAQRAVLQAVRRPGDIVRGRHGRSGAGAVRPGGGRSSARRRG